jgi:hypothetical protein
MKLLACLILSVFSFSTSAQQVNTLVLKEIYHKPLNAKDKKPSKVQVDTKGGMLEVTTKYNNGCEEKFHFEFNFDRDMAVLNANETYGFNYFVRAMSKECQTNPWREAYMKPGSSDGGYSSLLGETNYGRWVYMISGGGPYNYARARPNSKDVTGVQNGEFKTKPYTKGTHTYFYFDINSSGHESGESCAYQFLFVYELTDEVPNASVSTSGCVAPDCSSMKGTIPVWNFQNNRGECWCPEGVVWDRMENRCR